MWRLQTVVVPSFNRSNVLARRPSLGSTNPMYITDPRFMKLTTRI